GFARVSRFEDSSDEERGEAVNRSKSRSIELPGQPLRAGRRSDSRGRGWEGPSPRPPTLRARAWRMHSWSGVLGRGLGGGVEARPLGLLTAGGGQRCLGGGCADGQLDDEHGPAVGPVLRPEPPLVLRDNAVGDAQAEAPALTWSLGREERIEDSG